MSEDCRGPIPDITLIIRGIREREINHETGRIKKAAFIPRRNGHDDDGLSVSQPAGDSRDVLMVRLSNAEGIFCQLQAGSVRMIAEGPIQLDVCPDPTELDPHHALIKGVPATHSQAAVATRLAERLAGIASRYIPPES
jgi:hypothetical protein